MPLRRWLSIAAALFAAGLVIGLLLPGTLADEIVRTFENMVGGTADISGFGLFMVILVNNVIALSLSFLFSPVFLVLPVLSLLLNGAVISLVSRLVVQEESIGFLVAGLLPHGVIEIPAYLLAHAAALYFGYSLLKALFRSGSREPVGSDLKTSLRWLGVGLALLVPAALIEAFVTPLFIGLFQ